MFGVVEGDEVGRAHLSFDLMVHSLPPLVD